MRFCESQYNLPLQVVGFSENSELWEYPIHAIIICIIYAPKWENEVLQQEDKGPNGSLGT